MVDNHGLLLADVDYQTRSWFDETMMGRVYGSGLSTLARFSVLDARTVHYSTCHGTLDGASDCLASKGFQVHRLSVGDGSIDFYNTHFEAGGGAQDQEARAVQVEEVLDFIDSWSVGQAVVFTGDFNLHSQDAADAALLEGLQERAELVDACESVSCAEPTHIDRVWVRSGTDMLLTVTDWSNLSADFLDDQGVDLSDHPPLAAMVEWAVP